MSFIVDAIGSFFGDQAQKHAAENVVNTFNTAGQQSVAGYNAARDASLGYFQPYLQGGTNAFNQAGQMLQPGFQFNPSDPSYAFRLNQGLGAVQRSAAAQGSLNSGGTLKALNDYAQGMASTEYGNQFNRLNQLAQFGSDAARGSAAAQLGSAEGSSNALLTAAKGMAGGFTNKGDAIASQDGSIAGGISGLGSFFGIPGF